MKRKTFRYLTRSIAFLLCFVLIMSNQLAVFATTWTTTTDKASSNTVLVEVPGSYTNVDVTGWLNQLNQIRWEACVNGYKNPDTGYRLTTADYVPLTWDSNLEMIARIRAAESAVRWNHTRPNNTSTFTVENNGVSSSGEILSWARDMDGAIKSWYDEKDNYVYGYAGQTGHYKMIINPKYHSIGLCGFTGDSTKAVYRDGREYVYGGYAGEFGKSSGNGYRVGSYGECKQLVEILNSSVTSLSNISGASGIGVGASTRYQVSCNFAFATSSVNPDWSTVTRGVSVYSANWKSSNPNVAKVDHKGNVTGVSNGTAVISVQIGNYSASKTIKVSDVLVQCSPHVQTYGWQTAKMDGEVAGSLGEGKRLEAIKLSLSTKKNLGITYTTHVQTYGWLPWVKDGELSGTEGESKRVEAIKIQLTGTDAKYYDIYYRVHAQNYGWLGWAKNGAAAGTAGYSYRLEALQIVIVPKGGTDPGTTYNGVTSRYTACYVSKTEGSSDGSKITVVGTDKVNVCYRTHVQSIGWQGWKYNGQMSGTVGQSKRLEGIKIQLTNKNCEGSIVYRTHVQTYGWRPWVKDGEMSGTSGESKRLEAIEIKLTGEMSQKYDVYYRVQAQNVGWLGWAKNGQTAGTMGGSKRLESIQIVIVEKGKPAPSTTYGGFKQNTAKWYITF